MTTPWPDAEHLRPPCVGTRNQDPSSELEAESVFVHDNAVYMPTRDAVHDRVAA
jgi:hypothetical protein